MLRVIIFIGSLLLPFLLYAQVTGTVLDTDNYPLAGATVRWLDGPGTTAQTDGTFTLALTEPYDRFTVSYLGFVSDTIAIDSLTGPVTVVLRENGTALSEIEVVGRDRTGYSSTLADRNIESVTSKELRKAPCCSLAESFENSPVVDLNYGDPLTGRREIQMLGLGGRYSLFTLEKRPAFTGLASPYALDLIPGPWASGIQIGKGAGSLESGAGGLSGQINTELHKPVDAPPLFLNLFTSSQGRGEANLHLTQPLSEQLSAGAYLHGSFTEGNHDRDRDGFLDMPDRRTGVGLLRLFRQGNDDWEGQWNVLVASDYRLGGQREETSSDPYTIRQRNDHLEVWGKTGFFGFDKEHQSLGVIYSFTAHELDNRYGRINHSGSQRTGYLNLLYNTQISDERHQLSLGASGQLDYIGEGLDEELSMQSFQRDEQTFGAFGEYTFRTAARPADLPDRNLTVILGMRLDQHNLGGVQASPRLNFRYAASEGTVLRLTAGRAWRSPSVLAENLGWLPTSRQIRRPAAVISDDPGYLGLETAWSFGFNFTQDFPLAQREAQISFDAYRTDFQDRIVVDVEQDAENIFFYPLAGASRADGFLTSFVWEMLPLVDLKLAYKYNYASLTYADGVTREQPYTPRHRGLATLGYDGKRFKVHFNYHWTGRQRLPDHDPIPEAIKVEQPQTTPDFGLLNTQLTYVVNDRLELYGGGENLTDVRQERAIIGADAPFGEYFDATRVYQPIFGRRFYLGLRFTPR